MLSTARTRAEAKFVALLKKDPRIPTDADRAREERAARMAHLRALRLAKEAAEKKSSDKTDAEKAADKAPGDKDETPRLPQAHRFLF